MKRISALKTTTALIFGLGVLAISGGAAAQVAGGESPAETDSGGLEEIVVTAQKREESLQRAAIAITAVTAEDLQRASVTDATQLTSLAPSLQISSAYGPTSNFFLRGVGNFVVNVSSDPAVIVNLDGVPLGRPTGVQGLFYDLQRVEVLKGPQGTLYGRNATGGAINVITAQPRLGELSGFANFSYGNYNAVKADGALNVPMGENGALRLAGMISKRDGTYTDGTGDENLKAFRLTMASQLTETLKVTVGFDYSHMGGVGSGTTLFGLDPDDRIGLNDPRAGAILSSPAGFVFTAGTNLQPLHTPNRMDNDFWGVRLQADLDTSIGTISFIPSYREGKISMITNGGGLDIQTEEKDRQTTAELRLVSPLGNPLQYIFGAFYYNENDRSFNDFNYQYASFLALIRPKTESLAGYGRLTYSLTPELRFSVGARYTIDRRSSDDLNRNQFVFCPGSFTTPPYNGVISRGVPGAPFSGDFCFGAARLPLQLSVVTNYPANQPGGAFFTVSSQPSVGKRTFKKLTWRAGVEYDVGPDSLLYGAVETGYKSGGFFSSPDPNQNSFEPESITAFTIGSKNRFLDNRLQVNLEAFWWKYSDQQVSHFVNIQDPVSKNFVPVFATDNIGKSRFRGIELEMRAQIMENTEINGTVQYLDARNTNFVYSNARPPNTGCTQGPSGAAFFVDCSGRRPANAPVWTLMGGVQQRIPLGDSGDLTFNAQTRYQSGSNTSIDLLPAGYQKGFFTSDLQLEYRTADQRFSVAGFVNNIENTNALGFTQAHNFAPGIFPQSLRMPRTYGVRAGVKF